MFGSRSSSPTSGSSVTRRNRHHRIRHRRERTSSRSRSGSPVTRRNRHHRERTESRSRSHSGSRSGSRSGLRSRSPSGSPSGSHPGSHSGSHPGSHSGSHPGSHSGSHPGSHSGSHSGSRSRSRTSEKIDPPTHYLFENDNENEEKEEILKNGNVGDILKYYPNNQMGAYTAVIKLDNNGEKYFKITSSYFDDHLAGNLKRKNTQKNKKKMSSRRR